MHHLQHLSSHSTIKYFWPKLCSFMQQFKYCGVPCYQNIFLCSQHWMIRWNNSYCSHYRCSCRASKIFHPSNNKTISSDDITTTDSDHIEVTVRVNETELSDKQVCSTKRSLLPCNNFQVLLRLSQIISSQVTLSRSLLFSQRWLSNSERLTVCN